MFISFIQEQRSQSPVFVKNKKKQCMTTIEVYQLMEGEGKAATVNHLFEICKEKQLVPPSDGPVYDKFNSLKKKDQFQVS